MRLLHGIPSVFLNRWLVFGALMFLHQTDGFRNDLPRPKGSYNLVSYPTTRNSDTKEQNANEKPLSNYDFYKPLTTEENNDPYPDDWVKFTNEDRKWLEIDSDKYEGEEKPRYGYERGLDPTPNSKYVNDDDSKPFSDERDIRKVWNRGKSQSKVSKEQEPILFKSKNGQRGLRNANSKTFREDDVSYKSYPIEDKHRQVEEWNSHDSSPNLRGVHTVSFYEKESLPKYPQHDIHVNQQWNEPKPQNHELYERDWKEQKVFLHNPHTELLIKDGKVIKSELLSLKDGWRGKKELKYNLPNDEYKSPKGKESFKTSYAYPKEYSYSYYTPEINHGGHSYGWMYKPGIDMYHSDLIEPKRKLRFLEEHRKKVAEFQKKHMESYSKFMDKQYLPRKPIYEKYSEDEVDYKNPKSKGYRTVQKYDVKQGSSSNKYESPRETRHSNLDSVPYHFPFWNLPLNENDSRSTDAIYDEEERI